MPNFGYASVLAEQHVDGPVYSNSASEALILGGAAVYTLPVNFLHEGSRLRVTFAGRYSNVTTTPTLRLILRLGPVGSGVVWFDTAALTTQAAPVTNTTFKVWADLSVRSIGSGTLGTLMATGWQLGLTSATVPTLIPPTAPAVSAGFDTTLATAINLSAIWGTQATGNTLTLHDYLLESLN